MTLASQFESDEFERLFRQWLALSLARLGYGDTNALFPQTDIVSKHAEHEAALDDAAKPENVFLQLHQLAHRDPALASSLIESWFKALLTARVLTPRSPFLPRNKGGRPRKPRSDSVPKSPGRPPSVTPQSDADLLFLVGSVVGVERDRTGALVGSTRAAVDWMLENLYPETGGVNLNKSRRDQLAKTLVNRASSARSRKRSGNP